VVEVPGRIEPDLTQNKFSRDALVLHVMESEAGAGMGHAQPAIGLVQHERNQRGLPVVHVDDVGVLVGLQHELKRRLAEEGKALHVVGVAIDQPAVEEILEEVGLDKEALHPIHETEEHIAVDPEMMIRNPQVAVALGETPDTVVFHDIVLGQDDLHMMPANGQLPGQSVHHVGQSAHLGYIGEFRGYMNDIHDHLLRLKRFRLAEVHNFLKHIRMFLK
jgi:hypothetical protein